MTKAEGKTGSIYSSLIGGKTLGAGGLDFNAISLASAEADSDYDATAVSVLVFSVGKRAFAVAVDSTEGVVDCPRVTPLPGAPDGIVGIVSVRGKMTLAVDASLDEYTPASRCRLILLRGEAQLGLLADQIHDIVSLHDKDFNRMPARNSRRLLGATGGGKRSISLASKYFKREGRRVPVLDPDLLARL
ncbi:MAG TPA: chemotaxis protein CheW [Blastocatellia bacterium]|nr:chemotaxis protein CheW [Blastocatellia bacterium]